MLSVSGSAQVALAVGVCLVGDTVLDETSDVTHVLNSSAALSLRELSSGRTIDEVCDRRVRECDTPDEVVRADLLALLDQLDRYDLIEVRSTGPHGSVVAAARAALAACSPLRLTARIGSWLVAPPGRRPGRRYAASWWGVVRGVLRSQRVALGTVAAALPLLALAAAVVAGGGDRDSVALAGLPGFVAHLWIAVAAFFALTVLHERAHIGATRWLDGRVLYVLSSGWAVSVVHVALDRRREALVGLAGPLTAAGTGTSVGLALHVFAGQPLGLQTSSAATILAMGSVHLLSLGPWSEDGRSVLALLSSRGRPADGTSG